MGELGGDQVGDGDQVSVVPQLRALASAGPASLGWPLRCAVSQFRVEKGLGDLLERLPAAAAAQQTKVMGSMAQLAPPGWKLGPPATESARFRCSKAVDASGFALTERIDAWSAELRS